MRTRLHLRKGGTVRTMGKELVRIVRILVNDI